MAKAIGIFLCFALIGAYEFPRIWQRKNKYDLWVYGGLFLVSAAYCMLFVLDVPLPDPNSLIRRVFGGIGEKLMTPGS